MRQTLILYFNFANNVVLCVFMLVVYVVDWILLGKECSGVS